MENIKTPLGHVTMVPKGTYDSTTTYNRLDLVTYTNNDNLGVYVSKQDNLQNIPPSTTTAWMKLIDSNDTKGPQGDTGPAAHFEFIGSSITTLPYTENAYVTINESGEDTAKSISFNFGIPKGEPGDSAGFGTFVANASQSDTPFARVSESGPNTAKRLSFEFGIPAGPTGAAAGFAAPTATIQALSTSEPTVSITTTGDNTNKKFIFDFGLPLIAPVVNPIEFELKGDQMKFGLFENGNDANVELRTAYSGSQVGITISQYTQGFSQRQRTLTLLNSQGNTSIPGDLTIAGDLNLNKPLSVESGGTNITSNPSMIINLSSTQAANVFNTNPQPGVTGILPLEQGGTSCTTAQDAANKFINALSVGTSSAERNDYIVAQYANGGDSTTTYHRRKLSNIFAALNSNDITTALGFTPANSSHTHSYLPLSGGTLTGNWQIKNTNMDSTASSISSNTYNAQGVYDKNGNYVGYIQTVQYTNGQCTQQISARKYTSTTTYIDNCLSLNIDSSGTRSVSFTQVLPWRKALLKTDEPINSTANDTVTNWSKQGNCVAWYNHTGLLNNQPSQFGLILNLSADAADISQLWFTQGSGTIYRRSGNAAGWNTGWLPMYTFGQNVSATTNEVTVGSNLPTGNIVFVYE